MYSTTCPMCGRKDTIRVTFFKCYTDVPLSKTGFDVTESKKFETDDEMCWCSGCENEFPLQDVMEDERWPSSSE